MPFLIKELLSLLPFYQPQGSPRHSRPCRERTARHTHKFSQPGKRYSAVTVLPSSPAAILSAHADLPWRPAVAAVLYHPMQCIDTVGAIRKLGRKAPQQTTCPSVLHFHNLQGRNRLSVLLHYQMKMIFLNRFAGYLGNGPDLIPAVYLLPFFNRR